MSLYLALMAIPGVALAFHRAAEWWSRDDMTRTWQRHFSSKSSAAIPIRLPSDVYRQPWINELLAGAYRQQAVDASAAVDRGRVAVWNDAGERLFPTPIDPLHVHQQNMETLRQVMEHQHELEMKVHAEDAEAILKMLRRDKDEQ